MAVENIYFKKYQEKKLKEINYLEKGMDILYTLINYGFDAYIIGAAVCDLYLCKPIKEIEILTKASYDELRHIFPSSTYDKNNKLILNDALGTFKFLSYMDKTIINVPRDLEDLHYNINLVKALATKTFTMYQLALTPNKDIVDIFNGIYDIDKKLININDKLRKNLEDPNFILQGLITASTYGFNFEKHTIKAMNRFANKLQELPLKDVITTLRLIMQNKYAKEVLTVIKNSELFRNIHELDAFTDKVLQNFNLDEVEKLTLLYLIVGSIPDASNINDLLLKDITETIMITQLIMTSPITPMMVYNIGAKKLLSSDKIAIIYKKKYKSQAKKIHKLKRHIVINSPRELNFTELELIEALKGERSIRIHIIMNLLLEKVINQEVPNYPKLLKQEALKIDKEIRNIFEYHDDGEMKEYSEADIEVLLNKYHKELDFIVKIYLSDESELYSLSPSERMEVEENAAQAAKEFLLETSQYQVLEERRLI